MYVFPSKDISINQLDVNMYYTLCTYLSVQILIYELIDL